MKRLKPICCGCLLLVMESSIGAQAPDEFHAYVGGFFGPRFDVVLNKQKVLEYRAEYGAVGEKPPITMNIKPTLEQWDAFYKVINEHKVWRWKKSYVPKITPMDGTSWGVTLTVGDKHINSSGYAESPVGYGAFTNALAQLLGQEFY